MKRIILALAVLIAFLPAARADNGDGSVLYQWTFSNLTFVGDNACGANGSGIGTSPCVEVFNVSFEVSESNCCGFGIVSGTEVVTSTGPLGSFTCCFSVLPAYSEMFSGGNEVDQWIGTPLDPFPIQDDPNQIGTFPAWANLYTCQAGTCADDFFSGVPAVQNNLNGPFGIGTLSISTAPEPPVLVLMLSGILSVALIKRLPRFSS